MAATTLARRGGFAAFGASQRETFDPGEREDFGLK
jgi:hypothetical protein